ncbi:MAG: hypothetical protein I8H80_02270 [Alphaproteobacteria bacterium]|nr:hypothetical protein [Alphaproteobacteria bacterium]
MKKHLKTMLLLCGIIGATHGSNHETSDENSANSFSIEKQVCTARSALNTIEPNLNQVLSLTYDDCAPSRSVESSPPLLIKMIDRDYFSSKTKPLKQGTLSKEEQIAIEKILLKKPTRVTNTASGRDQTRTETSLLKEAQQNCLGKITDIQYKKTGAKQTVVMTPSATRQVKQTAPKNATFIGGLSWEEIVAEVERIYGTQSTARQ